MVITSAVAVVGNKQHGRACTLTRFSGGSASAWAVGAWYINSSGKIAPLRTDQISIRGEGYTPTGILRAVSKSLWHPLGFTKAQLNLRELPAFKFFHFAATIFHWKAHDLETAWIGPLRAMPSTMKHVRVHEVLTLNWRNTVRLLKPSR